MNAANTTADDPGLAFTAPGSDSVMPIQDRDLLDALPRPDPGARDDYAHLIGQAGDVASGRPNSDPLRERERPAVAQVTTGAAALARLAEKRHASDSERLDYLAAKQERGEPFTADELAFLRRVAGEVLPGPVPAARSSSYRASMTDRGLRAC